MSDGGGVVSGWSSASVLVFPFTSVNSVEVGLFATNERAKVGCGKSKFISV